MSEPRLGLQQQFRQFLGGGSYIRRPRSTAHAGNKQRNSITAGRQTTETASYSIIHQRSTELQRLHKQSSEAKDQHGKTEARTLGSHRVFLFTCEVSRRCACRRLRCYAHIRRQVPTKGVTYSSSLILRMAHTKRECETEQMSDDRRRTRCDTAGELQTLPSIAVLLAD
jgi:hypothetical protein